jgi:hypothetical protein
MGKDSYDFNNVPIRSNGHPNRVEDIRRDSIVDGPSGNQNSEYV